MRLNPYDNSEVPWHWTVTQETALEKVKELATEAPVLAYYDPKKELTIRCDASGKGLGAVLLQETKPIAYCSRALTDTETRYASIEKEMLAVVFAMERFHQYTYGRFTQVVIDHKPLEMIAKKNLVKAPKRLQGMLLRLQNYAYDIKYSPGKTMVIADMLSRAYLPNTNKTEESFEAINMISFLPIREERIEKIRRETEQDDTLQALKKVIIAGWPEERSELPEQLTPFFSYRDELVVQDALIFKANRVVIPQKLRADMLTRIHSSHLGTDGCLRRARESLFWPRMSYDIKQYIAACDVCRTYETAQQKETLKSHELTTRPWEKVESDLFKWDNKDYLVTVDYHSNFWEVDFLPDTASKTVVNKLKAHFARYGSPTQVVTDNGPQFTAGDFITFATEWDFEHVCSSPGHSQSNGKAESAVKTAKRILTKCQKDHKDVEIAFLDHRNTPTSGLDTSPAQRLMNRRTRTLLPTAAVLLNPKVVPQEAQMKQRLQKQADNYNKNAKELDPLAEGDVVRMKPLVQGEKGWTRAVVTKRLDERSYQVESNTGIYRRNRVFLRKTPEDPPENAITHNKQPKDSLQDKPSYQSNNNIQDRNSKTPQTAQSPPRKTARRLHERRLSLLHEIQLRLLHERQLRLLHERQ